ncbi:hypothetical protein LIER_31944 [Lithospermum erythrorhizon]|uniref:hAT-like transposase RNase-H fold domain-containing protein n=1 Tax=Lithospermum erythrorhizon TaxID=34254 RepID=A0AAV3RSI4_LITER
MKRAISLVNRISLTTDLWWSEENGSFMHVLPNQLDWEIVYDICKFLEVFADVTAIISGSSYPTVNLFLAEPYRVKVLIGENCERARNLHLQMLASQMKVKYEKYWSQSNILISIGDVLDPRYKMIFITWVYPFLYTLGDDAKKREDELSSHLFPCLSCMKSHTKEMILKEQLIKQGVVLVMFLLEARVDDLLEFHFGEEPVSTSTTKP